MAKEQLAQLEKARLGVDKTKAMLTLSGSWGRCVFCPADVVRMNADRINKRIVLSFAGTPPPPDMVLIFLQADEYAATADTICAAINPNQGAQE